MELIAYVTDIHLDERLPKEQGVDTRNNWGSIIEDISRRGIKKIIFGGDIGEKTSNKWFFDSLKKFNLSLSLGNHDYFEEVSKYYMPEGLESKSELFYTQEWNGYKFIFLDSSSKKISKTQYDWFIKELSTPLKIILFIHHPLIEVGAAIEKEHALHNRTKMKNALVQSDQEVIIFSGHYHFPDERSEGKITQIITHAASFQVEKNPIEIKPHNLSYGYRIIQLSKNEVNTELIYL